MAAVLVVLAFIVFWRYTVKGKGAPAARLASLLAAVITVWVLVSFKNPSAATDVAKGAASGTSAAISGIGDFLTAVFS